MVIINPRHPTDEELKELYKPPANKWDERWLQIPTFIRKRIAAIPNKEGLVLDGNGVTGMVVKSRKRKGFSHE